ncbi:SCO family protein [Paludibacterium purpuratum]|uniref:Protein SCO1/2 n=1 Tax=Paludibacterium purpuratum TaxID=1144873 RepID=A0A4R7B3N2_9NEIS|nr:SCO family protein [Paludibacterium purpuratum]TDR76630.1 protein SCO1/2 [Paludibacterium purpuratum]
MQKKSRWLLALSGLLFWTSLMAAPLPGDSIYQLDLSLTDMAGKQVKLADFAGQPLTVSMFYGNCSSACPVLLKKLQASAKKLPTNAYRHLSILLVSLDPANDTADSLNMLIDDDKLDPKVFRLAVARNEADTRQLASVLGIKYRRLDNGTINHSTRIVLLDAQGRVLYHDDRIGVGADAALIEAWHTQLK